MKRVVLALMLLPCIGRAQQVDYASLERESVQDCGTVVRGLCRVRSVPDTTLLRRRIEAGVHAWQEGSVLHFAWRHAGSEALRLVGGIQLPLSPVRGTDLRVLSVHVPELERARFSYTVIAPGGALMLALAPEQHFAGAEAPPRLARATALQGRVERHVLESVHLASPRHVTVYVPPGTTPVAAIVYMTDGGTVGSYAAVLDTLIATGALPRVMLVGAASAGGRRDGADARTLEYLLHEGDASAHFLDHERFFADELVPWAEEKFGAAGRRIVLGASAGGAFALQMGLRQPELFAHVTAFSPSPPRAALPPADARVAYYLWAGTLEPSFLTSAERWRTRLAGAAETRLVSSVAGHDLEEWVEQLPAAIRWHLERRH